jgi:hypothetical protein
MKHLKENNMGYFQHLLFSWHLSLVLFIHGLFPCILTNYVSNRLLNKKK